MHFAICGNEAYFFNKEMSCFQLVTSLRINYFITIMYLKLKFCFQYIHKPLVQTNRVWQNIKKWNQIYLSSNRVMTGQSLSENIFSCLLLSKKPILTVWLIIQASNKWKIIISLMSSRLFWSKKKDVSVNKCQKQQEWWKNLIHKSSLTNLKGKK